MTKHYLIHSLAMQAQSNKSKKVTPKLLTAVAQPSIIYHNMIY